MITMRNVWCFKRSGVGYLKVGIAVIDLRRDIVTLLKKVSKRMGPFIAVEYRVNSIIF